MRIVDIFESIDQREADEVLKGLVATGDSLTAKYFMQTRYDSRHQSIDSAQRAAERMARKELDRKQPANTKEPIQTIAKATKEPVIKQPDSKKKPKVDVEPSSSSDSFSMFSKGSTSKVKPVDKFMKAYKLGSGFASRFLN